MYNYVHMVNFPTASVTYLPESLEPNRVLHVQQHLWKIGHCDAAGQLVLLSLPRLEGRS